MSQKLSLFKHQKEIIDKDPKKCGLFLGTGSSKTRIALELATGKTLVIAPKTQYEDKNWLRENKKWNCGVDLTVISKETFRRDWKLLPRFDTVIVDEAHTCLGVTPNTRQRNKVIIPRASQLFEALEQYLKNNNPDRFYLCTATIMKSPMTVWGAATLLGSTWDFYQFRHTFYTKLPMPGREVYIPKKDSATKDRLAQAVRKLGYVGRLEDYFDVPEQTYKTIYTDLSPDQKKRIREMKLEYPEPIVRIGKIHQIENGFLSGDEYSSPQYFVDKKIDVIKELALEFPRMVIFAKYIKQIMQIENHLRDEGYKVLKITGNTKDRGEILSEANSHDECILICQSQISAGWEAPQYPVMVFASMTYSIVDRLQAEGRILRANALKKNLYIDLVARGGIDEAVFDCIKEKKDFDERIYLEKHTV